jgi:hypothetical protein
LSSIAGIVLLVLGGDAVLVSVLVTAAIPSIFVAAFFDERGKRYQIGPPANPESQYTSTPE